ncbi:hypothetical protein BOTNAR_0460g00010 [Botryotinia narcissicola]|uniref:Uncharacterized protein n=1 Tax=Botryotinia narcissicola TaxID=278944 RepID=A0A4Z1HVK1_9HELO|nr:hypothetical protein BOTNAR_0460g00010 [Botryotinia narcissicola]
MPRTRSRHATRISRRSPPRETHSGVGIRPNLKKNDICIGCIITSKPRQKYNHKSRIAISQTPQDLENPDTDLEIKLYLEEGKKLKQPSFIVTEHIHPIPLSTLRAYGFKSNSRAFDKRLCKTSYLDFIGIFDMDKDRAEWIDTVVVKEKEGNANAEMRRGQKGPRVTFRDPWEEIRVNSSASNQISEGTRRPLHQRSLSEATRSTDFPHLPQTTPQIHTVPTNPSPGWYTYSRASSLSNERQYLIQNSYPIPSHLPPSPSPSPPLPTGNQQYHTDVSSCPSRPTYHVALPSVDRYDRSHWDARIHNSNTRTHDLEGGRFDGRTGNGNGNGEEGGLFVVVFLGLVGFVWWLYGK